MLIYITGISGTGKSTIRHELKKRGYAAYDTDEDKFRAWYNKSTDERAKDQKAWVDTDTEWRKQYWLKIERPKVEELARSADNEEQPVFLCGTTPNDNDVWDLFDKVISLSISNQELTKRLAGRTNNDYGKHPDDLSDILGWNKDIDERMASYGAIIVNAERPLSEVVDEIISKSSEK
jgi:broad-specificity NMP kinase